MPKPQNNHPESLWRRIKSYLFVVGMALLFLLILLWNHIFISIKPGEAGILWLRFFNGTITDKVFTEGLHVIWPWDSMTIYTVRQQVANRELEALTKSGLKVTLTYAVRYCPEYSMLGLLHVVVGPDYLERVILPDIEACLRHTVGQFDSEELYTSSGAVVETIVNQTINNIGQSFVRIDTVNIRKIMLPPAIQKAIDVKLEQSEIAKSYVYRIEIEENEALRRQIEADGISAANRILADSLTPDLLRFRGIQATEAISTSDNAKVIVIGSGKDGLPIILGGDR